MPNKSVRPVTEGAVMLQTVAEVAELAHAGFRGRPPQSELEAQQAEDVAVHIMDLIRRRGWTAPSDDLIVLDAEESRVIAESVVDARRLLHDARKELAEILGILAGTPSTAEVDELAADAVVGE